MINLNFLGLIIYNCMKKIVMTLINILFYV